MVDLGKIADSVSEISDRNADSLSNVSDSLSIPYIENGKNGNITERTTRAREGIYSQRNFCWKQSTTASSIEITFPFASGSIPNQFLACVCVTSSRQCRGLSRKGCVR